MAEHWMTRVADRAQREVARSKAAMQKQLAPTMLRRPNTSVLVEEALADPQGVTPQGREMLAKFLRDRYGEAARHLDPYLGVGEEEGDDNDI